MTVGRNSLTVADNRTDQNLCLDDAIELAQGDVAQFATGVNSQLHDLGTALGEGVSTGETGVAQKALHFGSGLLFRINDHGKTKGITHLIDLVGVFRVTDTGDGMKLFVDAVGCGAAKKIDLVSVGNGDQQIRITQEY